MFLQILRRSKQNGMEHYSSPGPLFLFCLLSSMGILFWNLQREVCANRELYLFASRDLATLLKQVSV